MVQNFFFFFFCRSALFLRLPFVKIPAVGVSFSSASTKGCPAVAWFGLRQGMGARFSPTHTNSTSFSALFQTLLLLSYFKEGNLTFLSVSSSPSSRLSHFRYTATTGKLIKPRHLKKTTELFPCCQSKTV